MDSIFAIADAGRLHPLDAAALARPFLLERDRPHPTLSLGKFFHCVEQVVLQQESVAVGAFLPAADAGLLLCLEKHGACGHVVSISRGGLGGACCSCCAVVAVGQERAVALAEEYRIIEGLKVRDLTGALPDLFGCFSVPSCLTEGEEMQILLSAWMDGFHEWHLEKSPAGENVILLWDKEKRVLDSPGRDELFFQAARILATFFDAATTARIFSWRHAAGDFIARPESGDILGVRLVTVRGFRPMTAGGHGKSLMEKVLPFLLETMLLLRLDRIHGTGPVVFLPEWVLPPAMAGFFAGLRENGTVALTEYREAECRRLLAEFATADLLDLYAALLPVFALEEEEEETLVKKMLVGHCHALARCLCLPRG